ncbi:MAG TPA: hypothetical protein VF398_00975, partial [bacterium]
MTIKKFIFAAALMLFAASSLFAQGTKTRSEIPDKYKWKPEHIYATLDDWQKDFDALKGLLEKLEAFKGTFAGDKAANPAQSLIEYNKITEDAWKKFERVWTYVNFNADVDLSVEDWSGREQQCQMLAVDFGQKLAWVDPEILR